MKIEHQDPVREELRALRTAGRLVLALPVGGALLGLGHAVARLAIELDPLQGPTGLAGPLGGAALCLAAFVIGLRAMLELDRDTRGLALLAAVTTLAVAHALAIDAAHPLHLALPFLLWGLWGRLELLGRRAAGLPRRTAAPARHAAAAPHAA
jgi:hypothetical protein